MGGHLRSSLPSLWNKSRASGAHGRTLLNAVLVGLAVSIDGGGDSLDTLVEVVLGGRASSRLLALCEASVSRRGPMGCMRGGSSSAKSEQTPGLSSAFIVFRGSFG